MRVLFQVRGKTPLVMHNIQMADKQNDFARQIGEIMAKRTKTEEDYARVEELEFFGGLYYDPDIGVHMPMPNILKCLEEAAKITKQGRQLIRAVAMTTDRVPLEYEGPRKPKDLWEKPEFKLRKIVGVQRQRVMRMRPIFRQWGLLFDVELQTDILDLVDLVQIANSGGRSEGLGDARRLGYGRFEVEVAQ